MDILGIQLIQPQAAITVMGIAIGISMFSSIIHKKLVDRKKMEEIRKRIEKHQKDQVAAQKADDKKKLKQLEREQAEVMNLLKKNFMMSMKPMLFTMPVFLIILWFLRTSYDGAGALIDMPFGIPFLSYAGEGFKNGMNWFGIYLISAIGTSLTIELIVRKVINRGD